MKRIVKRDSINFARQIRATTPREFFCAIDSARDHRCAQRGVVHHARHRVCDCIDRLGVDVECRVAGDLDQRRRIRGDHRRTARHRFQRRQSESFVEAWLNQRDRAAIERCELFARNEARDEGSITKSLEDTSNKNQLRTLYVRRSLDQSIDVLVWLVVAYEEKVRAIRHPERSEGSLPRRSFAVCAAQDDVINPVRRQRDFFCVTELRLDLTAHRFTHRDDPPALANAPADHPPRINAGQGVAMAQMDQIVNGDDERHIDERHDVMRRVKEIDVRAASDREQLADRVLRRIDHCMFHSRGKLDAPRAKSDVVHARHRVEQATDVRADAEVVDLPAINPHSHPRAAWANKSVMSCALRSQRNCAARSTPRAPRSARNGGSWRRHSIAWRNASRSPGSMSNAAPWPYSAIAPVRVAMTGAPHAIASSGGMPNPSYCDG